MTKFFFELIATDEMINLWTFPPEAARGCEKVLLAVLILEAKYKWHFHRSKFFKVTLLSCETFSLQKKEPCIYLLQFNGPTSALSYVQAATPMAIQSHVSKGV